MPAQFRLAILSSTVPGPVIIGHRGVSGFRPEHTLEAYELAINLEATAPMFAD